MSTKQESGLLKLLEDNLKKVLNDPEITAKERLAAIQVGSALMEKKSKMSAANKGNTKFFKGA